MHPLARIDYAIIIGYMALSLIMGFLMTRKASSSLDNYFLGGRSLPWYLLGVAGMANWFDLTGTMLITSFLFMLGPRGLFIEFRGGAVLILAFMLVYTGKWHRRSGCMTGAEWNIYRFGENRVSEAVRVLGAVVSIITTIMMVAYLIRGATLFMGMFFPFPPMTTTLVLVTVTTIYTMSSGFFGVVLTDLVQGLVVMVSCVIVALMAWHHVPDSASLAATAARVTGNTDWTSSIPAWRTTMPAGYENYSMVFLMASFYFMRHFLGGMGTGGEARYFGARSDRDCGLQSFQQALMTMLRWPLMVGFAVMGIYLVSSQYPDTGVVRDAAAAIHQDFPAVQDAHWHDLTSDIVNHPGNYPAQLVARLGALLGSEWQYKLPLVGAHGTINPEQILPAVLLNVVPTGLKGLIVVAMFAAMMSCKNGMVNGSSAYFVKDIYQNLIRPGASNRELIYISYATTLGIVIAGFYVGVGASSINNIWGWSVMSLMAGQIAPGMLRLYWWRCNAWGCVGGIVLGGVGAIVQRLYWPEMTEGTQFLLMTSLSFVGTIGGSLLTAPTPLPVLKHFYRTTRPFGLWGPLRGEFTGDDRRRVDEENRNDMIAVPFALLWQVTLFLMPMQLVIKSYGSFLWTLPLFLTGAAGMYVYWWKPLMARKDSAWDVARAKEPTTGAMH
jgi:solute:Na+ symporter, SSS family